MNLDSLIEDKEQSGKLGTSDRPTTTAANTTNVEVVSGLFEKLGYMHGLWMLVSREGTRILVRYESWIPSDDLIEGHMEVLGVG